jgi:putative membrane protein
MISSLVASLHFLALAMALGSIFMRGRYFKALSENPKNEADIKRLLAADNFWGVSALLLLVTGSLRTFAGLEKGTEFYLHNPLFHLKIGLFLLVFILEITPMMALIRLRMERKKGTWAGITVEKLKLYRKLNHYEANLVFVIVFVASAMARGLMQP